METTRYFFDTDDSSHWYMIPLDLRERWQEANEAEDYDTINDEFDQYRINGHPKWHTFTNPTEID